MLLSRVEFFWQVVGHCDGAWANIREVLLNVVGVGLVQGFSLLLGPLVGVNKFFFHYE